MTRQNRASFRNCNISRFSYLFLLSFLHCRVVLCFVRTPAGSSNGRTHASGACYLGSNPSPAGVRGKLYFGSVYCLAKRENESLLSIPSERRKYKISWFEFKPGSKSAKQSYCRAVGKLLCLRLDEKPGAMRATSARREGRVWSRGARRRDESGRSPSPAAMGRNDTGKISTG